ncbi:hypothetical protein PG993_012728 [Apiospora rasikravindrae]|uniref:Uncharacterized protein n=1 Tax=Apiospora rasikravindrae TaxID=990691 RepID=A0ABR1RVK3_9PEZI
MVVTAAERERSGLALDADMEADLVAIENLAEIQAQGYLNGHVEAASGGSVDTRGDGGCSSLQIVDGLRGRGGCIVGYTDVVAGGLRDIEDDVAQRMADDKGEGEANGQTGINKCTEEVGCSKPVRDLGEESQYTSSGSGEDFVQKHVADGSEVGDGSSDLAGDGSEPDQGFMASDQDIEEDLDAEKQKEVDEEEEPVADRVLDDLESAQLLLLLL